MGEVLLRQHIVRPVVEVLVRPHIVEVLLRQHFVLYVSEALVVALVVALVLALVLALVVALVSTCHLLAPSLLIVGLPLRGKPIGLRRGDPKVLGGVWLLVDGR